jgi:Predicted phosphohydrolases
MTLSDVHLFDPSLHDEGEAFESYLKQDRKLLAESEAVCDAAVSRVLAVKPDFLIVSGDLTKDGEERDHELLAKKLSALEDAGIKVIVVPGNHDIYNPEALSYSGSSKSRVPNVSPERFAAIYAGAGYGQAIRRDPSSLSYVAEPVPGLWVLALDSADYSRNAKLEHSECGGRLPKERLDWAIQALRDARAAGKAVVALEHHGLVEHYPAQRKYYKDYLLDDFESVGAKLASEGLRLVFTGHFHANDAAMARYANSGWLCDIETGSLVTYPCPLRKVTLSGSRIEVHTERIQSAVGYPDLQAYAHDKTGTGITGMAVDAMRDLKVPEAEAKLVAPRIAEAFLAHYAGDEKRPAGELLPSNGFSLMGKIVIGNRRALVEGLYTDTYPADNDFTLDLVTGKSAD